MTMGKDESNSPGRKWIGLGRGSARERGRIVLAKGRPKREIRDVAVGVNVNVFNTQTFTIDNCTCTIVRHNVGAIFPDLRCKM